MGWLAGREKAGDDQKSRAEHAKTAAGHALSYGVASSKRAVAPAPHLVRDGARHQGMR
jgi:hypothetical protein